MDYDFLHEAEDVVLQAEQERPCEELWTLFLEQGFTLYDDVFGLAHPKKPKLPLWQSEEFVSVSIYNGDREIYDSDDRWTKVVLSYMLATQPRSGIEVFAKHVAIIAERLKIPPTYRGQTINEDELKRLLHHCADELTEHLSEPGSKEVSIFIHSTYPR